MTLKRWDKAVILLLLACLLLGLTACEDRDNRPEIHDLVEELKGPKQYHSSIIQQENGTCVNVSYYYREVLQTWQNTHTGEVYEIETSERDAIVHTEVPCNK